MNVEFNWSVVVKKMQNGKKIILKFNSLRVYVNMWLTKWFLFNIAIGFLMIESRTRAVNIINRLKCKKNKNRRRKHQAKNKIKPLTLLTLIKMK